MDTVLAEAVPPLKTEARAAESVLSDRLAVERGRESDVDPKDVDVAAVVAGLSDEFRIAHVGPSFRGGS
jgi:hypothetical protein